MLLKPRYVLDSCKFRTLSESTIHCVCSSLKEQWEEEEEMLQAAKLPQLPAHFPLCGNLNFQGLASRLSKELALCSLCFLLRLSELSSESLTGPPPKNLTTIPSLCLCLYSVFPASGAREWWLCLPSPALQRPPELWQCHRVPVCRRLHVEG